MCAAYNGDQHCGAVAGVNVDLLSFLAANSILRSFVKSTYILCIARD